MPRRRHQDVVEALLDRLVAGDFAPGERLPKEVVVAEEYGVNRGTAREALRALEERRVAVVKHGHGSTVQPQSDWNVLDPMVASALLVARGRSRFARELHVCRAVVEVALVELAAENATQAERAELAAGAWTDRSGDDALAAIGRVAHNRPLQVVAETVRRLDSRSVEPLPSVVGLVVDGDRDAAGSATRRALATL
jgi:DNA-binding FadR family transcriptional regulator